MSADDSGGRAFRQPEEMRVLAAGAVVAVDRQPWFVMVDEAGEELRPATDWLLQLVANDCSRHTVRAYALSLLRYFRFLWVLGVPWQCATEVDSRDFVLWAKRSEKFVGNKHPTAARGGWNPVTGKRYQSGSYSASTINHTLTCVREFYAFQLERGAGPIVNPIPTAAGDRRHAHHHPERDFVRLRRDPLRQKQPTRTPRAIPDQKFDDLFRKLSCNRDRALVAMYVSSGVRASELLGLTGDRVNYGDQLLGVIRKGGRLEWVPASPDAFVWLRLYEMERGTARSGQAVWLTRREPFQRLSYDAFRAVLGRVNRSLGANWTTHDLRHTFAIRALEGGVPIHEVQALLGHASLDSTNIYTTPRLEDIVEHHRAVFTRKPAGEPAPEQTPYDSSELSTIFGVDP